MIAKSLKNTYYLILFIVYVFIANIIYYYVMENSMQLGQFMLTYTAIGLSLLGAGILSLPTIVQNIKGKGAKKLVIRNLVFGTVCLVLSLSRILVFTLLSRMGIGILLMSLAVPVYLEILLPFCAGLFFANSITTNVSKDGSTT